MGRATGRRKVRLDHDQSLRKICIIHVKKCKGLQNITPAIASVIKAHYRSDLIFSDPNLPKVICSTSRTALLALSKGKKAPLLPAPYDYSNVLNDRVLRSGFEVEHSCLICNLARENNCPVGGLGLTKPVSVKHPKLLCGICGGGFGRGQDHHCLPSNLAVNLANQFGSQELEQVASNTIKRKLRKSSDSLTTGKLSLRTKGPKLPILVRPQKDVPKQLSKERLQTFMKDDNLRYLGFLLYSSK